MGKVLTVLKVFPDEGVDAGTLLLEVQKVGGCNSAKVEDYVFGQKIVRASFIAEDSEGKDFEEIVSAVKGVSSCSVEEVGLV